MIVAIGGYLGLFIGLSANDVGSFLVDLGDKFSKRIGKKIWTLFMYSSNIKGSLHICIGIVNANKKN